MKWDIKTILVLVFATSLGIMIALLSHQSQIIKDHERNIDAYQTELSQLKTQNDELIVFNNTYKLKINELDKELGISKQEVKDIQNLLNDKIAYIAHIESQINVDTIHTVTYIENKDSLVKLNFGWEDKWLDLKGKVYYNPLEDISNIYISKLKINMPLIVGITDDYKIFAKTDNPYIKITALEGAEVDRNMFQRKWDWNWTFQAGIGLTYGLVNRQIDLGPTVSWGLELRF